MSGSGSPNSPSAILLAAAKVGSYPGLGPLLRRILFVDDTPASDDDPSPLLRSFGTSLLYTPVCGLILWGGTMMCWAL